MPCANRGCAKPFCVKEIEILWFTYTRWKLTTCLILTCTVWSSGCVPEPSPSMKCRTPAMQSFSLPPTPSLCISLLCLSFIYLFICTVSVSLSSFPLPLLYLSFHLDFFSPFAMSFLYSSPWLPHPMSALFNFPLSFLFLSSWPIPVPTRHGFI